MRSLVGVAQQLPDQVPDLIRALLQIVVHKLPTCHFLEDRLLSFTVEQRAARQELEENNSVAPGRTPPSAESASQTISHRARPSGQQSSDRADSSSKLPNRPCGGIKRDTWHSLIAVADARQH
jgi:hypothetical protein